jgi:predicted RNA-binding Zn-ribbon protein involved in translation (DUF1610 family)
MMPEEQDCAQLQVARGLARWKWERCTKCNCKPIVHDYEASEDWCPVCGHSEMWSDEQ